LRNARKVRTVETGHGGNSLCDLAPRNGTGDRCIGEAPGKTGVPGRIGHFGQCKNLAFAGVDAADRVGFAASRSSQNKSPAMTPLAGAVRSMADISVKAMEVFLPVRKQPTSAPMKLQPAFTVRLPLLMI
jgi:hypothetical protein